jgi:lysozyme
VPPEAEGLIVGRRERQCAEGATVLGIDVSSWQGTVDWQAVAASGAKYAFIRAFDGLGADREFRRNWAGAKAAGLLRGAYVYFRARHSGAAQAQRLLDVLGADVGELPPVLDLETFDEQPAGKALVEVRQWIAAMRRGVGRDPMLYAGSFWHFNAAPLVGGEFADLALWTPDYTEAGCPGVPAGWARWTFWQKTSTGRVPGIAGNVDVNLFNGDEGDLRAFSRGGRGLGWLVYAALGAAVVGGAWWWLRRGWRGGKG